MSKKYRIDIISDTHGWLSAELKRELAGADLIVHAGDICSVANYNELLKIAPVKACLGNNDFPGDFGPDVTRFTSFVFAGLRWQVCHYQERLVKGASDIAVCGHTHRPFIDQEDNKTLTINPGSPTYPRSFVIGASMGRIWIQDKKIVDCQIIQLDN